METEVGTVVAEAVAATPEAPKARRKRKRGQGGSIIKRGNSYTIIFRADGKQFRRSGYATKDEARGALNDTLKTIRNNTYVEKQRDLLFTDFTKTWMEDAKKFLKPQTWASYESALRCWITPEFGDKVLCDIRKAEVVKFLYRLLGNRGISRKFVKNVHILLHGIFEAAIEQELIEGNPAHKIKMPAPSPSFSAAGAEERIVPTTVEVAKTFEKLTPTYQALLTTAAITGARRGELLGLVWTDLDLEKSVIHVRRTLQRVKKEHLDAGDFRDAQRIGETGLALLPPKTVKSVRKIEIPPKLATRLTSLRYQQGGSECPFIFQSELGGPLDPDALYEVLHAAQDAAEVRHFGLHGLRHLYSSILGESGASVKFAQQRLGHADASTTLNIYTHLLTDEGREYAEKVEEAFQFSSVSLTLAKTEAASLERPLSD
jgi:integrase